MIPHDGLWLIPMVIGHVAFWIWTINVLHGLGVREDNVLRWNFCILTMGGLTTLVLAYSILTADWPIIAQAYAGLSLFVGSVTLPVITLARVFRGHPQGVTWQAEEWPLNEREAFIGTGRFHWMHSIRGNESLQLRRVESTLIIPGLPVQFDGLRILHLTDLHFAPCYTRQYFEAVAAAAAEWGQVDLVLFTGDLIDHDCGIDWVEPVLGPLEAKLGKFAILGNHDLAHNVDGLLAALDRAGYESLEGRWVTLDHLGGTLALGGTSYPWGPQLDTKLQPHGDTVIVLSHAPDTFPKFAKSGVDLILAGHNHGGQIRLPILGPILMPSRFSRRYDRGVFRRGKTTLFVSQGVGGKHPLRFGECMPEIALVTLRTESSKTTAYASGNRSESGSELITA